MTCRYLVKIKLSVFSSRQSQATYQLLSHFPPHQSPGNLPWVLVPGDSVLRLKRMQLTSLSLCIYNKPLKWHCRTLAGMLATAMHGICVES